MLDTHVTNRCTPGRRGRVRCAGLLTSLALVATAGAGDVRTPRTTPELLVDIARGHALDNREQYTAVDVQVVRTWLEAALKLEPSRTDAAVLLFELQSLSGDEAGAAATLAAVAQRDPTNEMAFARWVESTLATLQTHEKRREWLEEVLSSGRPAPSIALARCALAELALERLDQAEAARQVAAALEGAPDFPPAARLAFLLTPPDAPAPERVGRALRYLRTHPGDFEAAWSAGDALQSVGFFRDAAIFYSRAQRLEAAQTRVLPAGRFFQLSINALGRGSLADAITFAQAAFVDAHGGFPAALYLAWLLERAPGDPRVDSLRRRMATDAAQVTDPEAWQPRVVADVAWYYCTYNPEPQRALLLAESAARRLPSDRFALRVLAFAMALNGRLDEAMPRLKSLAPDDPFSAAKLAELLREAGRDAEADAVLADLRSVPLVGPANEVLRKAGYRFRSSTPPPATAPTPPATLPEATEPVALPESATPSSQPDTAVPATQPGAPATQPDSPATQPSESAAQPAAESQLSFDRSLRTALDNLATSGAASAPTDAASALVKHPEVAELVRTFDSRVLDFDRDPRQLVDLSITYDRTMFNPGEPWWVTVTLKNKSSFPITLGPDGVVNPLVLLSFRTESDRVRELPHLMQIALDRWRWLAPGAEVSIRQTLDVGPLRRISDRTPQQSMRVVASAILDPVMSPDGGWHVGPGGQAIEPGAFIRLPARTGGPDLHALFSALSGDSAPARIAALDVLCLLLAESQQAALGRLPYTPQQIPEERIRQAIHAALLSDSWETRVRAVDSLQPAGIDAATAAIVARNLEHPHWLVRMMALRLLARQGPALLTRVQSIAATDAEPIVRALAESYARRWRPATPAEPGAPATRPAP